VFAIDRKGKQCSHYQVKNNVTPVKAFRLSVWSYCAHDLTVQSTLNDDAEDIDGVCIDASDNSILPRQKKETARIAYRSEQ
jgi:hypothetical protein